MKQQEKLDVIIHLWENTLEEVTNISKRINEIEVKLSQQQEKTQEVTVECSANTRSIRYQWWILTFIWLLILIIFSNI